MTSVAEIVRLHELRMQAHAGLFNLSDPQERKRSAAALADLYFTLLGALSPTLFVEAGARDALISFRARKILPDARIVAFEPSPYNVAHYRKHFDYAGSRIEYEPLALAEAPGELIFYIRRSVDGMELPLVTGQNSLLRRNAPNTIYEELSVRAVRLDDHFSPAETEGCCLWVDVEGSTGQVLAGAERLLSQALLLMIELEDSPIWKDQWLAGQVLDFLYPLGLVPIARDFEWWPGNYNVICVRDRLLARADFRHAIDLFYSSSAKGRTLSTGKKRPPAPSRSPPKKRPLWRRVRSRIGRALPPRVAARLSAWLRLR